MKKTGKSLKFYKKVLLRTSFFNNLLQANMSLEDLYTLQRQFKYTSNDFYNQDNANYNKYSIIELQTLGISLLVETLEDLQGLSKASPSLLIAELQFSRQDLISSQEHLDYLINFHIKSKGNKEVSRNIIYKEHVILLIKKYKYNQLVNKVKPLKGSLAKLTKLFYLSEK